MSTLIVKNIKHPTADSDSIQLSVDGTITFNKGVTGNVGIGTDTPGSKLEVSGDVSATQVAGARIGFSPQNGGFTFDETTVADYGITYTNPSAEATFNTVVSGYSNVKFAVNRAERMRINSSGHVTKPNQPLFVGRFDQIASSASNYFIGVSELYNVSMSFNATNDRITVPTSGYYLIHAQQLFQSSGGIYLQVRVNGSAKYYGYGNPGSSHRDLVSHGMWYLNANDYVDFYLQGTSTYAYGGGHSLCYVQLVQ